jgi:hypothetical protein
MSKLDINIDNLNTEFINKLDSGLNNLNNINNLLERLDRPKSFSYNSYIKNLPNELDNIKNECLDIKSYIIKSCENYINTSNEIDEIIKRT